MPTREIRGARDATGLLTRFVTTTDQPTPEDRRAPADRPLVAGGLGAVAVRPVPAVPVPATPNPTRVAVAA